MEDAGAASVVPWAFNTKHCTLLQDLKHEVGSIIHINVYVHYNASDIT